MAPETRKHCERLIGIRLPRCRLLLCAGSLAQVCGVSPAFGQPFAYVVNGACYTGENERCNSVSVIDTATDTVLAPEKVPTNC
jgi:DNA-binding beta-propeller fold protein YncE